LLFVFRLDSACFERLALGARFPLKFSSI